MSRLAAMSASLAAAAATSAGSGVATGVGADVAAGSGTLTGTGVEYVADGDSRAADARSTTAVAAQAPQQPIDLALGRGVTVPGVATAGRLVAVGERR